MTGQGAGTAIVSGGSIAGLFAATALLRAGWQVQIHERSQVELAGRGAGIVTHAALIAALMQVGAPTQDLGVEVADRIAVDRAGRIIARMPYRQVVTSWDRIHQLLRALIPDGAYRLGRAVSGYTEHGDHVVARFEDGGTAEADLLIGADGFRSAIRAQLAPRVHPDFAGYVVWRALADEARLSAAFQDELFGAFGFYAPNGRQVVGYPIAGAGNDLRPGHRRYNFVWYVAVSNAELGDMLTDQTGRRHAMSIPPPLVRDDVLADMEVQARDLLPPGFIEVLRHSDRPFFTPIYDHCSTVFARGRVALAGDAACVARPHIGMGVTKAAADALALARLVPGKPVEAALEMYAADREPAARRAYLAARRLGAYVFDSDPDANPDGRSNPNLGAIMADTAVPVT